MAQVKIWSRQLSTIQNIFCAWPIVLIVLGGALGGLLGAAAWALNVKIMKSDFIALVTVPAVILVGIGAFFVYFLIVGLLVLQFPDAFA